MRLAGGAWLDIQVEPAWRAAYLGNDGAATPLRSGNPDTGACILDLRQCPREKIYGREAALVAVRRFKDRAAEGVHLSDLGNAKRIIEFYEQQLVMTREIGDTSVYC